MNVMVLNFSGNVGKSMLSKYMLSPRMEQAKVIPIETINDTDGDKADHIKGKQYGQLVDALALFDNAIIDVGSSNVEETIKYMAQYKGSHEIFDYFLVPVIHKDKQIKDTISTIEALSCVGISFDKIRLIFNMIESSDINLKQDFKPIFSYQAAEQKFTINQKAVVYQHDFFSRASGQRLTIENILSDDTDYNSLLKTASTPERKLELSQKRALKWLAAELSEKLDAAFQATFE